MRNGPRNGNKTEFETRKRREMGGETEFEMRNGCKWETRQETSFFNEKHAKQRGKN